MGQPPAILESMSVVDPLGNWLFRTMLAVLVWNVAWFALVILNPSDIVGRLFKWGREYGKFGPIRFGLFATSRTSKQFRIQSGCITVFVVIFVTAELISWRGLS